MNIYILSYFLRKIKQKGIIYCFVIIFNKIKHDFIFLRPWWIKAIFYKNILCFLCTKKKTKKRLLGIWDFKALPWSVGDPLAFVETLNVLKIQYGCEEVDICVVFDRENPGGNRGNTNLTFENASDYILDFLPLFSTCQFLGSILQFSSRSEYYTFIKQNIYRYTIFPPLVNHLGETYNFYGGAPFKEIFDFYTNHHYIPHLRIGKINKARAFSFYKENLINNHLPIVVSLKRTTHAISRNADPRVWIKFFNLCNIKYSEFIFVIVGLREEIFVEMRVCKNVLFAKDFGTTIMDDLSLIRTSFLYMCTTSGPPTIALFSDQPYLMFHMPKHTLRKYNIKKGDNFCFALNTQKIFDDSIIVTPEFLFDEFTKMVTSLNKNIWYDKLSNNSNSVSTHPTANPVNK